MGVGIGNPTQPIGIGTAFNRGMLASFENVRALFLLPVRMLQGQAAPEERTTGWLQGHVRYLSTYTKPLWFFMAISISLGVINLLPIPALDGGRILLTLPEIVFRRRIPAQYENMIHMVGFALLILLLVYINLQDFINPIQLP